VSASGDELEALIGLRGCEVEGGFAEGGLSTSAVPLRWRQWREVTSRYCGIVQAAVFPDFMRCM